jgi:hypothetical protein
MKCRDLCCLIRSAWTRTVSLFLSRSRFRSPEIYFLLMTCFNHLYIPRWNLSLKTKAKHFKVVFRLEDSLKTSIDEYIHLILF